MLQASRNQHGNSSLALWLRLYIYGLHCFFTEILFTAGWEFIVSGNWKLPGNCKIMLPHLPLTVHPHIMWEKMKHNNSHLNFPFQSIF
jgi:hypothetical protein